MRAALLSLIAVTTACGGRISSVESDAGRAPGETPSATATSTTAPTPPPPKQNPSRPPPPPPNPGFVSCGKSECVVGKEECCPDPSGPTCKTSCTFGAWRCDEGADCAADEMCCGFAGSSGGPHALCTTTPCESQRYYAGGDVGPKLAEHLCKTSEECAAGERCLWASRDQIAYGECTK